MKTGSLDDREAAKHPGKGYFLPFLSGSKTVSIPYPTIPSPDAEEDPLMPKAEDPPQQTFYTNPQLQRNKIKAPKEPGGNGAYF